MTIPAGRVATYGQVSRVVGGCSARMVGNAMAALGNRIDVPWHRVVNSRGEVSERSRGDGAAEQRRLLEEEGVSFDERSKLDLVERGWDPSE